MKKKDYIVIVTYHERYSFTQEVYYEKSIVIDEICKWLGIEKKELKERQGLRWIYQKDKSYAEPYDSRCDKVHIENIVIIEVEPFKEEGYVEVFFGKTNQKFGLMDMKK